MASMGEVRIIVKTMPDGYDPNEQEDYDDFVPDLIDSIKTGYYDKHLRDITRAIFERRGVMEGDRFKYLAKSEIPAIGTKERPQGVKATVETELTIQSGGTFSIPLTEGEKRVEKRKADLAKRPWLPAYAELHETNPNLATDTRLGPNGELVSAHHFAGRSWREQGDFVYNGKFYSKQSIANARLLLIPNDTFQGQYAWEVVEVLSVEHKMFTAVARTQTSRSSLRRNSPLRRSMEKIGKPDQPTVKIPYEALWNQLH